MHELQRQWQAEFDYRKRKHLEQGYSLDDAIELAQNEAWTFVEPLLHNHHEK